MLNLDHLVSFKDCTIEGVNITSFNLIEGDWVYIEGDVKTAHLLYKLLTQQLKIGSGQFNIFSQQTDTLIADQIIDIRKSISYLPLDLSQAPSDDTIFNHIGLIKGLKNSESLTLFNTLKTDLIYGENIVDSAEVKCIFKALSTIPKILFIDFSFDNFDEAKVIELLDPIYKYQSKTGLAIILCSNNKFIKSRYKSRTYFSTNTSITE